MSPLPRRRLRAPTTDGAAFIDPPLSEAAKLIEHNRAVTAAYFDQGSDFPLSFRTHGRECLVAGGPFRHREAHPIGPLILSGHQPELFHPGVWLKNFVVSAIARSVKGTGVNLV